MDGEIERVETEPLTAMQIRAQVNRIQEVMKAVMKKGVHYGTVPGCGDKPTLLKPGAEKIMATFRLAADPQAEDLSGPDEVRYRVKVLILAADGSFVGAGIGECSSEEEKYKWKKAVCDEEFAATPEDRRRNKWKAGWNGKPATVTKQIRTNPADVANTVLKMAKKRAMVDGVLTATAASDVFEQDIEEIPEEMLDRKDTPEPSKTSTVKGKDAGNGVAVPTTQDTKKPVQIVLAEELGAYCGGDEERMKAVLKEVSAFTGKDNKEKYLETIKGASDKWAGKSLAKLRARIKEEGEGKEPGEKYPADCTKNPDSCEHSSWADGAALCGDKDCPYVKDERF